MGGKHLMFPTTSSSHVARQAPKAKSLRLRELRKLMGLGSEMIRSKAARKIRIAMCRMASCQITTYPKTPSALSRKMVSHSCRAIPEHFQDSWGARAPKDALMWGTAHDGSEFYRSGIGNSTVTGLRQEAKQSCEWVDP